MENTRGARTDSTPFTSIGHRAPMFVPFIPTGHHSHSVPECRRYVLAHVATVTCSGTGGRRGGVRGGLGWRGDRVTFLQSAIWNPQDFILLLLHDGHDLSANVGDAAGLDHTCNTEGGGRGRKGRG